MKKEFGFTLIELIVVLFVIGILAGVAFPSMQMVIENNRASTATNDLLTGLHYARAEAVRRNSAVRVEPSTNCPGDLQGWHCGWRAVQVSNGEVLREGDALSRRIQISQAPNNLTYRGNGITNNSNPNNEVRWQVNVLRGEEVRQTRHIEVRASGRVTSCDPDTAADDRPCPRQ